MAGSAATPSRRGAVLRLGILVALLIGAALVWWQYGPTDLASLRALARRARSMRDAAWAPPAFLSLYIAVTALGLPITPLTLAAGVIFGAWLGAALSWAGAVVGAAAGYLLARRLGASALRALLGRHAEGIEKLSDSTSFVDLLRLQLIPVVPLGALNIAGGVARVPFGSYVAAAAVGVTPGSVIYAYFADRVIAGAANAESRSLTHIVVASVLLIVLTFVPAVAGWMRGRGKSS